MSIIHLSVLTIKLYHKGLQKYTILTKEEIEFRILPK